MKKKSSQTGASMVETALLVSLVAVTAITSIQAFTKEVGQKFCDVGYQISVANSQSIYSTGVSIFIPGSVEGCSSEGTVVSGGVNGNN